VEGEFRPGGSGREWLDAEVLRRLRRRSLAALRREVEPVPQEAMARFLGAWQGVGPAGPRSADADALFRVVEQLQGAAVPASALERQVLAARLPGYHPGLLDELCASGEVVWAGAGALGSDDGWVGLYLAEGAPLLLPEPLPVELSPLAVRVRDALAGRGAMFFRQLSDAVAADNDSELLLAIWELVWAGQVTNDTLAPLRALVTGGSRPAARRRAPTRRYGRRAPARPTRAAPAAAAGRWSLTPAAMGSVGSVGPASVGPASVGPAPAREPEDAASGRPTPDTPEPRPAVPGPPIREGSPVGEAGASGVHSPASRPAEVDPTRRLHAVAEQLLDRHGILTRGTVVAERIPGGFAGVYPVLKAMEDSGRCRRGYFVDGLGGAQFAVPGAVDRLRALTDPPSSPQTQVLAAADPANPYGAALAWPERTAPGSTGERPGHRPGRKAGAVVILVDGELILYVERGGRTLLTFTDDPDRLARAADALALAVRDGALGRLAVEKADGGTVFDSPLARALTEAGFRPTARGLRLRG
jgi:ATP-dependent helicase Lhr and Lhr-like helicase